MSILKIISGGQTGVDIAALRAAKRVGLPTGGWMPMGFRTLDGPHPEYAEEFGMTAHVSSSYLPRTHMNVIGSDATLRIASNYYSSGEICTKKAIDRAHKIFLDVSMYKDWTGLVAKPDAKYVSKWIATNKIRILNIAGNSERTAPGIEFAAKQFLRKVFDLYIEMKGE